MTPMIVVNELVEHGKFLKAGEITEEQYVQAVNRLVDTLQPDPVDWKVEACFANYKDALMAFEELKKTEANFIRRPYRVMR